MSAADLQQAHDVFGEVLANVRADQLGLATPCASWDVRQLVEHVIEGARFRVVRLGGPAVEPDLTGALAAAHRAAVVDEVAAFAAAAPEAMVELPFGSIPVGVFVDIAAGDVLAHAWDLATATGQATDLAPELVEAVMARVAGVLSDRLRGPDGEAPFGARQEAPEGASAADRFAAFTGRVVS
jgi:uncharacterized protein (TIGR03086 family)